MQIDSATATIKLDNEFHSNLDYLIRYAIIVNYMLTALCAAFNYPYVQTTWSMSEIWEIWEICVVKLNTRTLKENNI